MKEILSSVFNAILWVLMLLLLFFVISGIYQRVFHKTDYHGFFGIGYAVVVSGSMEPNIHIDDMIIYQDRPVKDYNVGDVIVYTKEKNNDTILITHRIKTLDGKNIVTRGDANNVDDAPITFERVVGKVVLRVPFIGKAVNFMKSTWGLICAVILCFILFLVSLFVSGGIRKGRNVKTVMGEKKIFY